MEKSKCKKNKWFHFWISTIVKWFIYWFGKNKDLLNQVEGLKTVYVEIDGNNIEKELNKLPGLHSIEVTNTLEKRKGFTISVVGDIDPRPEIYKISKSKNWIIWELHEIKPKLEEIFRDLTTQNKKLWKIYRL